MKKRKNKFNVQDYNFSLVKMNVYSGSGTNEIENELTYFVLIDEKNFIHDYKIQFNKLYIKTKTTKSHENNNSIKLQKRKQIIEVLGLKHEFGSGIKNKILIDRKDLDKLNNYLLYDDWRDITFQNIEYVITGSNPSGQGKGTGTFWTKYNEEEFSFGFLFQCLNFSKQINKKYDLESISYKSIWKYFWENKEKIIDFDNWLLNNKTIERYLFDFKYRSKNGNWKKLFKELEEEIKEDKQEYWELISLIDKYRNKFTRNINYQKNNNENNLEFGHFLYQQYFGIDSNEINHTFDRAHIKPVWLIKEQYLNSKTKDKKILEQIYDTNNFLPLSKNIHNWYDSKFFYWNENGELKKIKEEFIETDEIQKFKKIKLEKLELVKKYLKEYIEYIKGNN